MKRVKLKKTINRKKITFYLKSCQYYRFPFFDPTNCYRQDGLFPWLEEALVEIGERLSREYGSDFISINLRGSWLRGIPTHGDDIDVLFIVSGLPEEEKENIINFTRKALVSKNEHFSMCQGKIVRGVKVEPVVFLDVTLLNTIMNRYMFGLGSFLAKYSKNSHKTNWDTYFRSELTEKKTQFLKSGILIPYVGWIYGRDRKKMVFDRIAEYLPVPTKKNSLYSELEIEETKETLRQAFIARNLIFPSLEIKKWINLKKIYVEDLKKEAIEFYSALKPIEEVYSRAIINYIYTLKIEDKLLGKILTRDRITKFAPTYNKLVYDILEMAYLRLDPRVPKDS